MAFLQAQGRMEPEEMARAFNCGIGMVLVVGADQTAKVLRELADAGETAWVIGAIRAGEKGCTVHGSDESWSARDGWKAVHLGWGPAARAHQNRGADFGHRDEHGSPALRQPRRPGLPLRSGTGRQQ